MDKRQADINQSIKKETRHRQADFKPANKPDMRLYSKEDDLIKSLLRVNFVPDHKRNADIRAISKDTGRMVSLLYRSKKYPTPACTLHQYKTQTRARMAYCCNIWAGDTVSLQSLQSRFDKAL